MGVGIEFGGGVYGGVDEPAVAGFVKGVAGDEACYFFVKTAFVLLARRYLKEGRRKWLHAF